MSTRNRLGNVRNRFQGSSKKVLCVCSAGLLRSPTAAVVLALEFGFNTRAAGVEEEFALIPVDEVLLSWADEIVCMTDVHYWKVKELLEEFSISTPVTCLRIPDDFSYMQPELVSLIKQRYKEIQDANK